MIFDTDITGDVDDVLALAMLHSLADRGVCEILAVTISKENTLAAPFVDAVNTFYGRPHIPIGVPEGAPHRDSKYLHLVNEREGDTVRYPHDVGVSAEPEMAVPLLRKTLAAAEDGSVALIQVGLAVNLAQLLDAEGGKALIERKVRDLSVMAGAFQTIGDNNHFLEANVKNHVPSMQKLASDWPDEIPVIWSGFSVGISVPFPHVSIARDFNYVAHHPVKEAYLLHCGPDHDRPTWDLTSVLYSAFAHRGFFTLSGPGRVAVADDGFTTFQPAGESKKDAGKRDRYPKMDASQRARVSEALVHLVVQPPKSIKPEAKPTVKLIFDTDMGNDIDDAMALAMIHALERRGACELLAVTSTKDHPKSTAYIDALNTFYHRPDVPIGAVRHGVTPEIGRYLAQADQYPHDLMSGADAPDAVSLLRRTLAAQPDHSVTVAQVGFFTNLAQLLDSPADEYSPLNGVELAGKKVKQLAIMAGAFQTIRDNNRYAEYNVWKDIPSAQKFVDRWPSPIVWSGYEVGGAVDYPWQSIQEDFETAKPHPIKESYVAYVPTHPHNRPTWDLTAVFYGVYPDRGYFDLSSKGTVTVADDGATFFKPAKNGDGASSRDRFLIVNPEQCARVREAFVQLVSEPAR